MAKQGNIVSFEDARRSSARRHADEWAMYGSAPSKSSRSKATRSSKPAAQSSSRKPATASASAPVDRRSTRSERTKAEEPRGSKSRRTTGRSAEPRQTQAAAQKRNAQPDARERKRRAKTKERADKQFTRQYAAAIERESAAEDAPRAALHKGEMGASQRKSTRMQRASQADSVSAKIDPAGWFSRLSLSSRTAKIVTGVLCAVLICAFLYTPAQQYYQAVRENARLEVEYAAISERNAALDEHNEALASDAGMEDAVRQKYGYIVAGEQTAVVTGLSDEVDLSKKQNAQVEANVLSSSIKAPEEWYTPILDAIFNVQ